MSTPECSRLRRKSLPKSRFSSRSTAHCLCPTKFASTISTALSELFVTAQSLPWLFEFRSWASTVSRIWMIWENCFTSSVSMTVSHYRLLWHLRRWTAFTLHAVILLFAGLKKPFACNYWRHHHQQLPGVPLRISDISSLMPITHFATRI